MSVEQVTVPDIGGAEGAEVIELLVAVGDEITLDQGLIVLESDKASMEIPSTVAGKVVELLVAEGDQLAEGAPIAKIEVAGAGAEEDSDETADSSESEQQNDQSNDQDGNQDGDDKEGGAEGEQPAAKEIDEPAASEPASENTSAKEGASEASAESNDKPSGSEQSPTKPATASVKDESSSADSTDVYAGPAVRRLAREFGIALAQVTGSGPQGRILKEDLQQYVQKSLAEPAVGKPGGAGIPTVPEIDFGKFGEIEVTERSKIDKLTAANMHRSWLNVPHVTQFDDADITDLEAFRKGLKAEAEKRGTRITPLPFLLKACAVALRDNPRLNSSLARGGEDLVHKKYIHIGMAVDTPAGLVVPVIRDVDQKTIWELAAEVVELAAKARDRKLSPAEMQGGCFTISSLGNIGGSGFTPIVNTPEVGILGVSRASVQPVWNGEEFMPRTMLPLALSYDHRVVNGGDGGRFMTQLVSVLSDIRLLSL